MSETLNQSLAVVQPDRGPMSLIEMAVARGASIDELRQLFELKREVEAEEAKRAYVQAMADFKTENIHVIKDKTNNQYGSKYSSISSLVNTVNPLLGKHGLSADWEIDQSKGIRVTCVMTHRLGFSKRFPIDLVLDTSGAKNPLQQIKSSVTYGKIVTFESACGIATHEGNLDDDGTAGGGTPRMAEDDFITYIENIRAARDTDELKKFFNAAYIEAKRIGDTTAQADFIKAKDARKREI